MLAFRLKAVILILFALIVTIGGASLPEHAFAAEKKHATSITNWDIQWIEKNASPTDTAPHSDSWIAANVHNPLVAIPEGYKGAWVRIAIPPTSEWLTPGLLVRQIYGLNIDVFEDGTMLYHSDRNYSYDRNMLLSALPARTEPSTLLIRISSLDRAGLVSHIQLGEFNQLSESFIRQEMPNLLLGASVGFLAILMLLISGYLTHQQRRAWIALSLIALATSILIITYSTFPYVYFRNIGKWLQFLFDMSMLVVFPALHLYVGTIFEGKLTLFRKFGTWFAVYCAFGVLILILNAIIGDPFFVYYKLFTFWMLAPLILMHLLLVLSQSIIQAIRGNKASIILSLGFLALATTGVVDLIQLYTSDALPIVYLWKFGIILLIVSLVIVLARKIKSDHQKLLDYSKELELFNHQLQRTEKLKFVSELAASIAHEVRNPLQVTRGFLQLISSSSDQTNKNHFSMAIDELDRASLIITDFLTFAKPELDTVVEIDIKQELNTVETIMSPLASISGAVFKIQLPDGLIIVGNPSKFKQAFMNLIKNSIEALKENGVIEIDAEKETDWVLIRIADNGEGMNPEQIARLGEPYFSTKSKGTGLGLMVTYRLIEIMDGSLEFRSEKGKGTEALIRFPLVRSN
ncbi:sensor histidine kinase [Cohnella fermenti]|uniref:histidine kinase n=1 Tax=Cohnella fermenti TaxID=2565925 RepID=A0A4S4C1Y2_9BACL|nr:sensor histidine kinase [Cohnella fermenti]THF81672.1 sensor histidine kinase [Cohnella fermenti]